MSTAADSGQAGDGYEGEDPLKPGLYEFDQFNRTANRLPKATRATLHRHGFFDDADIMREWLGGSMAGMATHLNQHLREHQLFPAIAASAWLGLRASRDGSEIRWFLRVFDGQFGARVGPMDGGVVVIIEVPQDWVGAKALPPAPDSVLQQMENYLSDATYIAPGQDPLVPPPVARFDAPPLSLIDRIKFLLNPESADFSVKLNRPQG